METRPDSTPTGSGCSDLLTRIRDDSYPCIMAKAALDNGAIERHQYAGSSFTFLADVANDLRAYLTVEDTDVFQSFVAVFPEVRVQSEREFERWLWKLLARLHRQDGAAWDESVSQDIESPAFSFSFSGQALFVIGMHRHASRLARRVRFPTVVFNRHSQFERIRARGTYAALRDRIRDRDADYSGDVNPMVADHMTISEARQYSGRAVGPDWRCPWSAAG